VRDAEDALQRRLAEAFGIVEGEADSGHGDARRKRHVSDRHAWHCSTRV